MQLHEVITWQTHDYPVQIVWGRQNSCCYIALANGNVAVGKTASPQLHTFIAHEWGCTKLCLNETGLKLATAGQDNLCKIWDVSTWQCLQTLQLSKQWVTDMAFAPQTDYLAVISGKVLHIYSPEFELVYQMQTWDYSPTHVQWLNSTTLVIAKYGGLVRIDLAQNAAVEVYPFPTALVSLACSPNERWVAGGTQDQAVHLWQLPYQPGTDLAMSGYMNKVKSLAWYADSTHLATHSQNKVVLWNVAQKGGPAGSKPIILYDHAGKITKLLTLKKNNRIWSGDNLGMVCLFEHAQSSNALLKDFLGSAITDITTSPSEDMVIFATEKGQVGVYQIVE
ncbi:MAG: WD40 repeat domain-containing protein [Microscillaceae bacterium]|nr:WD40 repeat domain-containing protein [Microscillaceae bacterium]MDW8460943.1 WD40 repeat domain-containing protein [Cytophagales bacterium]